MPTATEDNSKNPSASARNVDKSKGAARFFQSARSSHRLMATVLGLVMIYFAATGSLIQWVDLHAVLTHAAATDPDMLAIRESIYGTGNFALLSAPDFAAPALPVSYDYQAAMTAVMKSVRSSASAGAPVKYVEVRMLDGTPTGLALVGSRLLRFDPATGTPLPPPPPGHRGQIPSLHQKFKNWHRLSAFGDAMSWINALVGIGLFGMIVTGLVLYFQLLRTRRRSGKNALFWSAGGWWRAAHRGVSVLAAVFLLVVSISGTLLSIDGLALGIYQLSHRSAPGRYKMFPPGMIDEQYSPLADKALPAMLQTTLAAYRAHHGAAPIKVMRLRTYAHMPQGAVVYAASAPGDARQAVFDASTGREVSMTEPGYPYTGFPFGWEEHELMKRIHRGDVFGAPGRFMDLFAGLSLLFLSASGLWMYVDQYRRRRRAGRTEPFWA